MTSVGVGWRRQTDAWNFLITAVSRARRWLISISSATVNTTDDMRKAFNLFNLFTLESKSFQSSSLILITSRSSSSSSFGLVGDPIQLWVVAASKLKPKWPIFIYSYLFESWEGGGAGIPYFQGIGRACFLVSENMSNLGNIVWEPPKVSCEWSVIINCGTVKILEFPSVDLTKSIENFCLQLWLIEQCCLVGARAHRRIAISRFHFIRAWVAIAARISDRFRPHRLNNSPITMSC